MSPKITAKQKFIKIAMNLVFSVAGEVNFDSNRVKVYLIKQKQDSYQVLHQLHTLQAEDGPVCLQQEKQVFAPSTDHTPPPNQALIPLDPNTFPAQQRAGLVIVRDDSRTTKASCSADSTGTCTPFLSNMTLSSRSRRCLYIMHALLFRELISRLRDNKSLGKEELLCKPL